MLHPGRQRLPKKSGHDAAIRILPDLTAASVGAVLQTALAHTWAQPALGRGWGATSPSPVLLYPPSGCGEQP